LRIRRRFLAAGSAVLAGGAVAVTQVGPSGAQAPTAERPVSGHFSLIQMVHTTQSTPNFSVPATVPWGGAKRIGQSFSYRSIACTGAAPINNIASDLPSYGTRVRESRAPSSMRAHPFRIRVRKARAGGWELLGRIQFTVCQLKGGPTPDPDPVPDFEKPKITVRFTARFKKMNAENLRWNGRFTITGGTGRYDDLTGSGEIAGYFFCFNPQGCASTGRKYRDGQFVMHGKYRDPTPQLAD
jgi:hypothetical protein